MKYLQTFEATKIENLKKELKELLSLCTTAQQGMFKRMYSHNNLDLPIDEVVDNMENRKVNHALFQVKNSLEKTQKKYNL